MKNRYHIISESIEECFSIIKLVCADEKTDYVDPDCFEINEFEVKHKVVTRHNSANFKRRYNQFKIEGESIK